MAKKLFVCAMLSACLVGGQCYGYGPGGFSGMEATYVPEGDEVLEPKPEDFDVVVFVVGDEPQAAYRVIGHVHFDTYSYPGKSNPARNADVAVHVLDVLIEEARRRGADALVDFNLIWNGSHAEGRAKAVVFE